MLEKDLGYYEKNKKKFRELYHGKYIVIKNKSLIGVYGSHEEAYNKTAEQHDIGTFIIKHVVKRG